MAIVVPYDPTWPQRFQAASAEILAATYHLFLWLEHIGSTAKPTIDMMASVRRLLDGHAAQPALAALGYELADSGMRERLFFQRLARPGVSAHHLHAVTEDSWATRNGHPPPLGLIPLTCTRSSTCSRTRPAGLPAIVGIGCAGRGGDADTRPAPVPATTAGKPPRDCEDHDLRFEAVRQRS